jgi:hypothetical protein
MELEAESVAFVVCDAVGLDAGAWIRATAARIQRAAERILSALDAASAAPPAPPDAADA